MKPRLHPYLIAAAFLAAWMSVAFITQIDLSTQVRGILPLASVPNLPASRITSGQFPLTRGGTGADLSSTGGASQVVQQASPGAAFSVGQLTFPDIVGTLPLSRGGTSADLSGTGGTSQVLQQSTVGHAITVAQLAFTDLSGTASTAQIPNLPASKITSGQIALARGGTNADLSGTGGTSQVLKQTSLGAAVTVAQLAFTDISGSVAASQLPNPTSSTLGGIESYAAVSNQWINAISTSGVPSSTQPTFSNISSTLAGSQMPTTFETAGIGWFFAAYGHQMPGSANANPTIAANKFVYGTLILYPLTIRKISFDVNTAQANSHVYVALYDSTGSLISNSSTGAVATTSTGVKQTTLGTPFTINPGFYYVAIFGDTAGVVLTGSAGVPAGAGSLLNTSFVRLGNPTNGISGGAVPSTLGTINANNGLAVFDLLFES